jgi:arginase
MAGLAAFLEGLGHSVESRPAFAPRLEPYPQGLHRRELFRDYLDAALALREEAATALAQGSFPLALGGDHSLSIASVSAALEQRPDLVLIWIDAHLDLNTPSTSASQNLHGMPVAALLRLADEDADWKRILAEIVPPQGLPGSSAAWFGVRDVDPGEAVHASMLDGSLVQTMERIDRLGAPAAILELIGWLEERPDAPVWISFDVDCIDPFFAPGTGTAVRAGLTEREAFLLAEMLGEALRPGEPGSRLIGMDVVEVNPLADRNNETAFIAAKWVEALFGRRILGSGGGGR